MPAGSSLPANTIHGRITLDNGFIYTWSPDTGNWTKRGELWGAIQEVDFPRNVAWSTPVANAMGGLFTSTFSWAPVTGAVAYEVDITPDTASRVGTIRVTATSLEVTDLPASSTTYGTVVSINADGTRSPQASAAVTTPGSNVPLASAPTSFAHAVTASNGNVRFTWGLPATNGNLVGSWVLEMRQAGSLYRREAISGRTTLAFSFLDVPAGTYSATLVAQTAGGPGPAATIATITVPTRVTQTFPAPVNPRLGSGDPTIFTREELGKPRDPFPFGVRLHSQWDTPPAPAVSSTSPRRYFRGVVWCPSIPANEGSPTPTNFDNPFDTGLITDVPSQVKWQ